jgi:hypothetical protein
MKALFDKACAEVEKLTAAMKKLPKDNPEAKQKLMPGIAKAAGKVEVIRRLQATGLTLDEILAVLPQGTKKGGK